MRRLLLIIALLLCTAPAAAQSDANIDDATRAMVRELADQGGQLYQDGKYDEALKKLERAYEIYRVPSIGYYSARCLEAMGRWVEASERYVEITRLEIPDTAQEVHRKAQTDAKEARAALVPRIPRLRVVVKGADPADVEVKVDGAPLKAAMFGLSRPADPGEHVVVATRWDDVQEKRVILDEGKERVIELVFEPKAPPPPPVVASEAEGVRTGSFVLMGIGGAGLIAGAVTGTILLVTNADLSQDCDGSDCIPSRDGDEALPNAMRLPTTITLAAGGALLTTGLLMYFLGPEPPAPAPAGDAITVRPLLGPGFIGLDGRF